MSDWRRSLAGLLTQTAGDTDPDKIRWGKRWTRGPDGKFIDHGEGIKEAKLVLLSEISYGDDYSNKEKKRRLFVFKDPDYIYLAFGRRPEKDLRKIQITRTLVLNEQEIGMLAEALNQMRGKM